ncbi:hypothetical protein [Nonomuraea sp. CA-141351]
MVTTPVFDVACRLVYDESGFVLDYPGLASRVNLNPGKTSGSL